MLGVGYNNCTSIHLATHGQDDPPTATNPLPVWDKSGRISWKPHQDVFQPPEIADSIIRQKKIGFSVIGAEFESTSVVTTGRVGTLSRDCSTSENWLISLLSISTRIHTGMPCADEADV